MKTWKVAVVVAISCAINLLAVLTCHAHERSEIGAQCDAFEHCTPEQIDTVCEQNGTVDMLGDALAQCSADLAACHATSITSTPTSDGTTSTTIDGGGSADGCRVAPLVEEYDCRHYGPRNHRGLNCAVQLGPWHGHCAKVGRARLDGTRKTTGCAFILTERASVGSLR